MEVEWTAEKFLMNIHDVIVEMLLKWLNWHVFELRIAH